MQPWNPVTNIASIQTPQQLNPIGSVTPLDLTAIQGDLVIGLQKKWQRFVFFTIGADIPAFKGILKGAIAVQLTTAKEVQAREAQLREHKLTSMSSGAGPGQVSLIPMVGLNVGFSHTGLQKLLPASSLQDSGLDQLARTPAQIAQRCGDTMNDTAPRSWEPQFLQATIDGVFLITGGTQEEVDEERAKLLTQLRGTVTEVWQDGAVGNVRPGREAGREHFGWQDGLSQPAVVGIATPLPGQDAIPAGQFVFGAEGSPPSQPWMLNGSLMVFRKLEQAVPAFNQFLVDSASALGMDVALLGARMMGRWKSGAPLAMAPLQDDEALARNPERNNDFDFKDDQEQRRCPFGAHIRKTNPRADLPGGVSAHRVMRAGIPYGTEAAIDPSGSRGLLFVCYQTSIEQQFEFVQNSWSNNTGFIFGKTRPQPQPVRTNGTPVPSMTPFQPGHDPVIGQAGGATRFMDEPVPNYPTGTERSQLSMAQEFVTPRAGAYFFVPSIPAVTDVLSTLLT